MSPRFLLLCLVVISGVFRSTAFAEPNAATDWAAIVQPSIDRSRR